MAGRTSSTGHTRIPEARLDRGLRPAELKFKADVKEEGGNVETAGSGISFLRRFCSSGSHRESLLTLADSQESDVTSWEMKR